MQEAAMGIEFPIDDCPKIRDQMYTKDSLTVVETKLIELWVDASSSRRGWSRPSCACW